MAFFTLYSAIFFNDKGEDEAKKVFSKKLKKFDYKDETYIVDLENARTHLIKGLIWDTLYFQYKRGNPLPIPKDDKRQELISASILNSILQNNAVRQINDLSKKGLEKLLTPRNIIIGIVAIGILIYLGTGHKLF